MTSHEITGIVIICLALDGGDSSESDSDDDSKSAISKTVKKLKANVKNGIGQMKVRFNAMAKVGRCRLTPGFHS